jgi:hypothetical protein
MATATSERAKGKTKEAAESDGMQWLARLGLVARGFLYLVVGFLAFRVAMGSTQQADRHGAFRAIGRNGIGRWSLVLVAVGFFGYALWRLAEATVRPGDKSALARAGAASRGVLYLGFAVTTISFVVTKHAENSDEKEQDLTARVLDWPGGRYLVAAVGLALVGAGVANAWRALSSKYRKRLKQHEIDPATLRWLKPFAYAGLAARFVVFSLVGAFLVQAAITYDAEKARGIDGSLRTLAKAPYGEPLIMVVAAGLVAFGLWCFVEARYRKVLGS